MITATNSVISQRWASAAAVIGFIALWLASNAVVADRYSDFLQPTEFAHVSDAAIAVAMVLCVLPLFAFAKFSFGYLVGLYMYGMIAGFIFISYSTKLQYDHAQARVSALACLVAFLIPVLFLRFDIRRFELNPKAMDRVMTGLLIASAVVLAWSALYGLRFGGFYESLALRGDVLRPRSLDYLIGIIIGAILPFALAYFAINRRWLSSCIAGLLMISFFPILLNKTVVFAPFWTLFLLVLFQHFHPKNAAILTLLLPMLAGGAAYLINPLYGFHLFGLINFRMITIPSLALDHYFEFFSTNPNTWFCQIGIVGRITGCPYTEQLGVIMQKKYQLGNFNGSLFTTEGIASVGPLLAPLVTFVCGVVIGLFNVASFKFSPVFVAASSGVLIQSLMNIPMSTVLLSNGGAALLFLWLISPSSISTEPRSSRL